MNWLKRMWLVVLLTSVGVLMFGPGAKYIVPIFGDNLDMVFASLYSLSACNFVLLVLDFMFDRREGKGVFPTLDVDHAVKIAAYSPTGAGLIWLGFILLLCTILFICVPRAHADEVTDRAQKYLPQLTKAVDSCWPNLSMREHPAGKIHLESRWNAHAELRTSREWGRGFAQPTIAWDKNGKERFNSYKDATAGYKDLRGWDWKADPFNTSYQLKLVVLRDRGVFRQIRPRMINDEQALKVTDVIYNAGDGRYSARKFYAKLHGMKTDRWDGGLREAHGPKENVKLYGQVLYKMINAYPDRVFQHAALYRGKV